MMQKRKITIEVSEDIAASYERASPEKRHRAQQAMAYALLSRTEAAEAFQDLTARMSDYARKQGLTPERLDELLEKRDAE